MKLKETLAQWRHKRRRLRRLRHATRRLCRLQIFKKRVETSNAKINNLYKRGKSHGFPVENVSIPLRGYLSLKDNPEETSASLFRLDEIDCRYKKTHVFIDVSNLEGIDAASVAFICSRIGDISRAPHASVSGNVPSSQKAHDALIDSGFFDYVYKRQLPPRPDSEITLRMIVGKQRKEKVDPVVSAEVAHFLTQRHASLDMVHRDMLSNAVSECIENVRIHAYEKNKKRKHGWYVVGLYDADKNTSSVAILDLGDGVRSSLERSKISLPKSTTRVLMDVTEGKLTAMKDKKHGKGLNSLKNYVDDTGGDGRFSLCSSGAMIQWSSATKPLMLSLAPMLGTIVMVDVTTSAHGKTSQ